MLQCNMAIYVANNPMGTETRQAFEDRLFTVRDILI
jgi:hypothetical protein